MEDFPALIVSSGMTNWQRNSTGSGSGGGILGLAPADPSSHPTTGAAASDTAAIVTLNKLARQIRPM